MPLGPILAFPIDAHRPIQCITVPDVDAMFLSDQEHLVPESCFLQEPIRKDESSLLVQIHARGQCIKLQLKALRLGSGHELGFHPSGEFFKATFREDGQGSTMFA